MSMSVTALEGAELDYWVAKALGATAIIRHDEGEHFCEVMALTGPHIGMWFGFSPSIDWLEGGPIIDANGISTICCLKDIWHANSLDNGFYVVGRTALIAAMRCYVLSKLGPIVPPPVRCSAL